MKHCIRNERGFAAVYGLVILLLVTVGGTALLFMARKDRANAGDYSKMRTTAQAANAALKACEGQFLNHPDTALTILKKYKTDATYKFILNASSNSASDKIKYQMAGAGSPEYIAEIKGFDQDKQIVLIEGTGFGGTGGKKKVLASYQLDGLKMVTPVVPAKGPAIHLNGGFSNLDHKLTITGNVYAGGTNNLNGNNTNTPGLTITGSFKTGTGSFVTKMPIIVNTGNAYFRGTMEFQSAATGSTFNGKSGFKSTLNLNGCPITCNDNVYLNGSALGTSNVTVSGASHVAYYNSFSSSRITTINSATKQSGVGDIPTALGLTDADDAAPTILDDIEAYIESRTPPGKVYDKPSDAGINLDADNWNLTTAYTNATKWNNFLVVKVPEFTNFNKPISTEFSGKMIWIFDGNGGTSTNARTFSLKYWYSSSAGSNTLIYVRKKIQYFTDLGEGMTATSPVFRGVIYQASTATNSGGNYKFKSGTTVYGTLIHSGSIGPQFNTPSSSTPNVNLIYDETLVNEFVTLGILTLPTGGGGGGTPVLTLVDKKIRPKLLTKQL